MPIDSDDCLGCDCDCDVCCGGEGNALPADILKKMVQYYWPNIVVGKTALHPSSELTESHLHAMWTESTGLIVCFDDIDFAEADDDKLYLTLKSSEEES